jgi:hypothetical protein
VCFGEPVVTTLVCFISFCMRGYGCIERPAFPAPSLILGRRFLARLGRITPRERGAAFVSPPSARAARGGEGSGVGGFSGLDVHVTRGDTPTPDLESELRSPRTPPLRGGRGEEASRHCERSEAIHSFLMWHHGLLRGACHRAGVRPTRWLAMTLIGPRQTLNCHHPRRRVIQYSRGADD